MGYFRDPLVLSTWLDFSVSSANRRWPLHQCKFIAFGKMLRRGKFLVFVFLVHFRLKNLGFSKWDTPSAESLVVSLVSLAIRQNIGVILYIHVQYVILYVLCLKRSSVLLYVFAHFKIHTLRLCKY